MPLRSAPAPSIHSFRWNLTGWEPAFESTDNRRMWRNAAGDLLVQRFDLAVPSGLPMDWRNSDALRASLLAAPSPKMAFVSIDAVTLGSGIHGARYVHKEHMPSPSLGMTYVGILSMPFEDFFSNLIFACMEHGTTGIRESVLVATGKVPMPPMDESRKKMTAKEIERMFETFRESAPKLMASDDEQWDEMFPEHPLSRVRAYLRNVQTTLDVDDAVRLARPFGL